MYLNLKEINEKYFNNKGYDEKTGKMLHTY